MSSLDNLRREFVFGSFVYQYELVPGNRNTLSLTVKPNLKIYVKCPLEISDDRLNDFLKRKWLWLEKQLRFFAKHNYKKYKKEYISGESLYYLGRQYKLIVKSAGIDKVSLSRGLITVYSKKDVSNWRHTKMLVAEWYQAKKNHVFKERFEEVAKRFEYKNMPEFRVRDMARRWGSFLNKDRIILNPKLIYVSKDCIDYVIAHELCHLRYKNHSQKFFELLEEKYPKWEKVKQKLELMGAKVG